MAPGRLGCLLCIGGPCVDFESGCEDSDEKMESQVLKTEGLSAYYGDNQVVKNVTLSIPGEMVTAVMGPSGCGKSTLVRCFNRMHEMVPGSRIEGKVFLKEEDVYDMDPITVRTRIGMVFQRPNPFPMMTIYDNVIAGYKLNGVKLRRSESDQIVEESLKKAALWDEVKEHLNRRGTFLSGGQQQRLCIARALAVKPDILLFDEPTSALDPKATAHIEELVTDLKKTVTLILVTHNIAQTGRVSDFIAFLYLGELIEFGPTDQLLTTPKDKRTDEFLTGKFG
jgi:phosphate transport system ATP-binding protein